MNETVTNDIISFEQPGPGLALFCFSNVSKYNYCFSDFPFPDDVADYPHNVVMANYIADYVKQFNVGENIKFMRKVLSVDKIGKFGVSHRQKFAFVKILIKLHEPFVST